MKWTSSWVVLAVSLLLIAGGLAYSQMGSGPEKLPKDIVTNVSYDATINAGQVYKFKIPLQQGGTIVKIRFATSKEEPVKNPTLTVGSAADLDAALNRSAKEQEGASKAVPFSLIVTVGSRQIPALPTFSGGAEFTFKIDASLSTSPAAEGSLKNLTSATVTGKVLVSSIKTTGLQTYKTNRSKEQINSAISSMKNPDLFWTIYHTMQRHAANYPGGQSDHEKQYAARLSGLQISTGDIAGLTNKIKPYEGQIKAKVADKSLTQLTVNQSIQTAKINALLKAALKPTQQLKVVSPQQKPAGAPPPPPAATITASSLMGKNWSFEAKNYPGYYVRHLQPGDQASLAQVSTSGELTAATFRVAPGIADNQNVSLEAVAFPGNFVSFLGGGAFLSAKFPTQIPGYQALWRMQTFVVRPGLADQSMVSFESLSNPGLYLRHRNFKLYVEGATDNLAKGDATFKPVTPMNQNATGPKYRIKLIGIESKRCADDAGWEYGCDREEPYIVWTCFGPSWDQYGITEHGKDVRKNTFYLYAQGTNVYGSMPDGRNAAYVETPLIFIYMVIEADPDGPSTAQVLAPFKTIVGGAKSLAEGNWKDAAGSMIDFWGEFASVCVAIAAGGDDKYPPMFSAFDDQNLIQYTTGSQPMPVNKPLTECVGNYNGFSVLKGEIKGGWNVYWTILRQTN